MNVLLLSDIHSNFAALDAVVRDVDAYSDIDEVWVLGDLVGYGPDPQECLTLLNSIHAISVAGNHDLAIAGLIRTTRFNPLASAAVQWTRDRLPDTYIKQLKALPERLERRGITLVHGSPGDPVWEYVDSEFVANLVLKNLTSRGVAVGHTHVPAIFERSGEITTRAQLNYSRPHPVGEVPFLVNPGSVGQPRDHDPRASYAVLDLAQESITHHRVEYDVDLTARRIQDAQLPDFLADRLRSGI